jgi:hypothetical protein
LDRRRCRDCSSNDAADSINADSVNKILPIALASWAAHERLQGMIDIPFLAAATSRK